MSQIVVKIDNDALNSLLSKLASLPDKIRKDALSEVGEYLVEATKERFDKEEDPNGQKWAPNSPTTLQRKKAKKCFGEKAER